ncbi:BTB/POZ domain-containing protein 2-like [Paramacrobiotus metropolitanus]|uniref:BTB/POZ domain-containing protein 2-like n=1 Tax=Paramacrobiotus metropolitanus TaxID=2943436 RepID=UPI002445B373|nr:BTB/POZ domain-containing protein 2-like [Paramacrobiotus metropolitanus]
MSENSVTPSRGSGGRAGISKISDGLQRMLASGERSDIQFTVGRLYGAEKIFPAHGLIMGVRSSVLHAALDKMFSGTVGGSYTAHIDLPDVHPEAFANMLSYIYTDDVKNLSLDNAFHTLRCADKYGLPLLGAICTNFILNQIRTDSCLDMLDTAVRYANAAPCVLEKCLSLIDKSTKTVWESDQFCEIGEEALRIILQRDTLTASEDTIYSAVDKWAAQMCIRRNMDASSANRRKILGQTFFLLRFPLLTDAHLMDGPVKNGLLLQSEGWDIYRFKHATVKPELPFPTEPRQSTRVTTL